MSTRARYLHFDNIDMSRPLIWSNCSQCGCEFNEEPRSEEHIDMVLLRIRARFDAHVCTPIAMVHDANHISGLGSPLCGGFCMSCKSCHSGKIREYTAEINVHFPGKKGLSIPSVMVSPKLSVCLNCGATQFTIPETEREALADGDDRGWADDAGV